MRAVLLSMGAVVLLLTFGCSQNEGDASGSTGLRCDGSGTAPACFAWNGSVTACFEIPSYIPPYTPIPGPSPEPVPTNFSLTIESGEGSAYCTTPGTVGQLSVTSAISSNVYQGDVQRGSIQLSGEILDCGDGIAVDRTFAYSPSQYGTTAFGINLGNKGTFGLFVNPSDQLPETDAQFCFQTENSGTYQLNGEDGSRQNGTWTK